MFQFLGCCPLCEYTDTHRFGKHELEVSWYQTELHYICQTASCMKREIYRIYFWNVLHKNSLQPDRYYCDNPRFCSQQRKSRCTFLTNQKQPLHVCLSWLVKMSWGRGIQCESSKIIWKRFSLTWAVWQALLPADPDLLK